VEALGEFLSAPSGELVAPSLGGLTAREREVLEVLAEGIYNYAIAARLGISEKTVRNHVSIIFSKLQAKSRARAVALARDAGVGRRLFR
jgi:DNA-binding NarL/FixJ family response regulator